MRTRTALILLQLDILCTSAVKPHCPKNNSSLLTCQLFIRTSQFVEANKTCHRVAGTSSIVNFLLCRALQQNWHRQILRDVGHLKRLLLHCDGPD